MMEGGASDESKGEFQIQNCTLCRQNFGNHAYFVVNHAHFLFDNDGLRSLHLPEGYQTIQVSLKSKLLLSSPIALLLTGRGFHRIHSLSR